MSNETNEFGSAAQMTPRHHQKTPHHWRLHGAARGRVQPLQLDGGLAVDSLDGVEEGEDREEPNAEEGSNAEHDGHGGQHPGHGGDRTVEVRGQRVVDLVHVERAACVWRDRVVEWDTTRDSGGKGRRAGERCICNKRSR